MSYAETGLPQNPLVEKAWALVKTDIGALWSAQLLAETAEHPDPEMLAAHFIAFAPRSVWTAEKIAEEFSGRTSDIVMGMRDIYDKRGGMPAASADDAVKLSFLALGIVDLEYRLGEYGRLPLDNIIIDPAAQPTAGNFRPNHSTVRQILARAHDKYDAQLGPLTGTTSEPALEKRFTNAMDKIADKLKQPVQQVTGQSPYRYGT